MSTALARPLLRRQLLAPRLRSTAARRFESSSSSTAQKTAESAKSSAEAAKKTAEEYKTKAAEGLSRVTSAAGPAITGAAKGLSSALGRVGGRTGRFVAFVERQVPFVIYYSKVGLELGKLVFRGQKMDAPSVATFQSYFNRALSAVKNPGALLQSTTAKTAAANPSSIAERARNISTTQVIGGGVLLAEVLGFFTVGEIIGRFKLVGYHGEKVAHH